MACPERSRRVSLLLQDKRSSPSYLRLEPMAVAHSSRLSYDDSVTLRAMVCPRDGESHLGAFGDKFRTERERRGFTLDDVSNVTKINARMLKAIEEEHFDLLPGGVFNKGFVRAYAKHLGFNDEESVNEYLAALRQAQVQAQTAAWQPDAPLPAHPERGRQGQNRVEARTESRRNEDQRAQQVRAVQLQAEHIRTERIRAEQSAGEQVRVEKERPEPKLAPPAAKVDLNIAARSEVPREIEAAVRPEVQRNVAPVEPPSLQPRESDPAHPKPPQKYPPADLTPGSIVPPRDSVPWKVPAVALAVILVAAVLWNRHSRGVRAEVATLARPSAAATNSPPGNAAPATAQNAIIPPSGGSNPTPSNSQHRTLTSNPATAATDHSLSDDDVTVRKSAGPDASASTPRLFTLRIRASETSWILVIADGQPILHENLIAPASTSVRAAREITVRVGNAAGVSFMLNGKEIPPQGAEAEVKTVTFDSQGLKEAFGTPSPNQIH